MNDAIVQKCHEVARAISVCVAAEFAKQYPSLKPDEVSVRPKKRWIAIDIGTSGAWLVDAETGEIYNIKGYGVPDHNKKRKSDIGNILSVDPAEMYAKRYNYLR